MTGDCKLRVAAVAVAAEPVASSRRGHQLGPDVPGARVLVFVLAWGSSERLTTNGDSARAKRAGCRRSKVASKTNSILHKESSCSAKPRTLFSRMLFVGQKPHDHLVETMRTSKTTTSSSFFWFT